MRRVLEADLTVRVETAEVGEDLVWGGLWREGEGQRAEGDRGEEGHEKEGICCNK